jgi:hypothetical protein
LKTVQKWRWRTLWCGRMVPGSVHYTEAEMRERHPEAERIPGSMIPVEVPETDAERQAAYEAMRRQPRNFKPDGQ